MNFHFSHKIINVYDHLDKHQLYIFLLNLRFYQFPSFFYMKIQQDDELLIFSNHNFHIIIINIQSSIAFNLNLPNLILKTKFSLKVNYQILQYHKLKS